mgnify:CR=1 FL=1
MSLARVAAPEQASQRRQDVLIGLVNLTCQAAICGTSWISATTARGTREQTEYAVQEGRLQPFQVQVLARVFHRRSLQGLQKIARQRHLERASHRGIRRHRRITQVTDSFRTLEM